MTHVRLTEGEAQKGLMIRFRYSVQQSGTRRELRDCRSHAGWFHSLGRQRTMSQGQALHILLFDSARHLIRDLATVPDKSGVKTFLEGYLAGKTITLIAQEIGVRREWVSRAYRKEGLDLAVAQFIRLVSRETSG